MSSSDGNDWVVIPLDPDHFSDGDPSTWPKGPQFRRVNDELYRHKLAMMWLQRRGQLEKGKNYILDRLPDNYVLFDRPRYSNPTIRDKFLWGHPSGSYFNSPNQLFPHFLWLMNGGTGRCSCENCKKKTMVTQIRPKVPGETFKTTSWTRIGPRGPLDPEGTPDVFRAAVLKLKERGTLDEPINETLSMDWRAEHKYLQQHLVKSSLQNSFIPRAGELVLWAPEIDGELIYDEKTNTHRVYSFKKGRWLGVPAWRAGTVGQTPEEDVVLEDLIEPMPKRWAVNYSGFRVETFPDPNSYDKSYSLQAKYVHLNCIRPLNYWQIFLQGIPQEDWHPSIKHALTVMSSISLVDKYRFKGTWPDASVFCRGIFIGAELLLVGDAVRLKPKGRTLDDANPKVTDVMVIDRIEFKLLSCINDVRSPLLAEKHAVRIRGKVYTRSPERAYRGPGMVGPPRPLTHEEVTNAFNYVGMNGYGAWYPVHAPDKFMCISQDMVLGRCYEPDAMKLIFDDTSLGLDFHGVLSGRKYSRETDERIPPGKDWFWGDYRTQALALDSLNGEDVGRYNEARNPKMWRGCLQVIDGRATASDLRDAALPRDRGRPPASLAQASKFGEVGKMSKLVSSGLGANLDGSANVSSGESSSSEDVIVRDDSSDESEESEDFTRPLPVRGGMEETELGDYVPENERQTKRAKVGK
ncbi:hypothetical protein VTN77DRAFT_4238 [Rasamsonia byssochlamydoides]|uniref:uncharacterized protein n=1 Tax=Rasamsonia byssochlamydoides TaxID=89139 RepID=UPI003742EB2C